MSRIWAVEINIPLRNEQLLCRKKTMSSINSTVTLFFGCTMVVSEITVGFLAIVVVTSLWS